MTLPQIFAAVCGGLLLLVSLYISVQFRTRRFKALFWGAVGAAMMFAGFRPAIIEVLGPDSVELRVRFIVALLSFIVLTVTLESIRVAKMQERYAFLWLATGSLLLLGALYPDLARLVAAVTGMNYTVSVLVVVFAFILLMLFHVSVALSVTQFKLGQIARELALAEERLRRLEKSGIQEP
jgi:hypothetical protein